MLVSDVALCVRCAWALISACVLDMARVLGSAHLGCFVCLQRRATCSPSTLIAGFITLIAGVGSDPLIAGSVYIPDTRSIRALRTFVP